MSDFSGSEMVTLFFFLVFFFAMNVYCRVLLERSDESESIEKRREAMWKAEADIRAPHEGKNRWFG